MLTIIIYMKKEGGRAARIAKALGVDESTFMAVLREHRLMGDIAKKVAALRPPAEPTPEVQVPKEAVGLYCSGTVVVDGIQMPCDWYAPLPEFVHERYKAEGTDGLTFGQHNVKMHKQTASLIVIK